MLIIHAPSSDWIINEDPIDIRTGGRVSSSRFGTVKYQTCDSSGYRHVPTKSSCPLVLMSSCPLVLSGSQVLDSVFVVFRPSRLGDD